MVASALVRILGPVLKRYGARSVKQHIWDDEFIKGKWNYLDENRILHSRDRDVLLDIIDRYGSGARILDLGCGTGLTGLEIADTYGWYVGVDISAVAIRKALSAVDRDGMRSEKNNYLVGDISSFVPDAKFSVILFSESIYYFGLREIGRLLLRYSEFLTTNGVFIVRLHDAVKHRRIAELIQKQFYIVEQRAPKDSKTLVLVFSPHCEMR
jgi:SAM-dependent methyltransferase